MTGSSPGRRRPRRHRAVAAALRADRGAGWPGRAGSSRSSRTGSSRSTTARGPARRSPNSSARPWKTVLGNWLRCGLPRRGGSADVQARAVRAIRELDARLAGADRSGVWVACTHGDVIKAIVADAMGVHLDSFQRIVVEPSSMSVVRYSARHGRTCTGSTRRPGDPRCRRPRRRRRRARPPPPATTPSSAGRPAHRRRRCGNNRHEARVVRIRHDEQ